MYLANAQQCHPCFLIWGSIAAEVFPQKRKKEKEKKDFVWLDYLKPESKIVVKMKHIP